MAIAAAACCRNTTNDIIPPLESWSGPDSTDCPSSTARLATAELCAVQEDQTNCAKVKLVAAMHWIGFFRAPVRGVPARVF
jgi:hypothetical protein